jgi:hexokinase
MFDIWELLVASIRSLVMLPSIIQALPSSFAFNKRIHHNVVTGYDRTMDDFLQEARRLFQSPMAAKKMLAMSDALQEEFKQKLQSSSISMLPSYIYTLPTGQERGSYLALDVGGSTFRVAFVELNGRGTGRESMRIVKMCTYKICNLVKALEGHQFFDWMADRIEETLDDPVIVKVHGIETLVMGLAWSFPIEYEFDRSP